MPSFPMARKWWLLLLLVLALSPTAFAGGDQWVRVTSDHFTVVTDEGEKEGRHVLDQFERMRWVFRKFFPNLNGDEAIPITVVAVKNQKAFDALLPPDRSGKGQFMVAGLFSRNADKNYILLRMGISFNDVHPYASVYHEYTHQQFAAGHLSIPIWLNEGMAEFMQNTEFRDKDVVVGEASRDDILYLRQNTLIPLQVLFKVDEKSPYYHEEQKGTEFYAESWALTHFLMINDNRSHSTRISTYVRLVGKGEDPVVAAQEAFGDLKQLEAALRAYIDHGQYMALALSSEAASIDDSTFKVKEISSIDAEALQADVMAHDQRLDDARTLANKVLTEDANSIQAHETLGYIASRAGQLDDARKWYADAIKLGSKDFLTYYNAAMFSTGIDGEDAERNLREAIRLNTQYAPSYDRLASVLAMQRKNLDEAHMLNLQAIQLDAGSIAYRINAANVLQAMERYNDALNVLKNAASVAHNERESQLIQSSMRQIEQNQQRRAEVFAVASEQQPGQTVTVSEQTTAHAPKFPTLPAAGPRIKSQGQIVHVSCGYPNEMEFQVAPKTGNPVSLYSNDYTTIELTAAANVQVPDTVNPCHDFEGRAASVEYIKSPTSNVDGQVMTVELLK